MNPRSLPYPDPTSPAITAVMRGNRRADTKPEVALRSLLHGQGYRYRTDHPIRMGDGVIRPDIVFTRYRVAVFVDGCFWHVCPEHGRIPGGKNAAYWEAKLIGNRSRDKAHTQVLLATGWRVVRIWEHESLGEAADKVKDVLP